MEMHYNPLVSVLVRTKNRPLLLVQALESIQHQTYKNIEVVLVKDGGSPLPPSIQKKNYYFSLEVIENQISRGRSAALNQAFSHSRGELVAFLDDDDLFYSNHLELLVQNFQKSEVDFSYSNSLMTKLRLIDGKYQIFYKRPYCTFNLTPELMLFENSLAICSIMMRRKLMARVGSFDENLDEHEDWDFWIRASQLTHFYHINDLTSEVRFFSSRNYEQSGLKIFQKHQNLFTPENIHKGLMLSLRPQYKKYISKYFSLSTSQENQNSENYRREPSLTV